MVNETELRDAVECALSDVRLLGHKFYTRWQNGELSAAELREYAEQYRHFEASLPGTLSTILKMLPDGDARNFIADNLADEAGYPSHVQLFDDYVAAAGGSTDTEAMPATQALVDAYDVTIQMGPAAAIGGIAAYEVQSPGISSTKRAGLCEHYGFSSSDVEFWNLHATLDIDHGDWALSAMASSCEEGKIEAAVAGTRAIAEAWWAFLDERQSRAEALAA